MQAYFGAGHALSPLVRLIRIRRIFLAIAFVFPFGIIITDVQADKIPLGLNSRHDLFIQELWQGKTPLWCVANRAGEDRLIRVSRWRSRQIPPDPLLQWPIAAQSVHCYDVSQLAAERLLEIKLGNGEWLGLLKAPRRPAVESAESSVFASFLGPNSVCPTPGTWIEQTDLRLRAGQPAIVTVLTTVNSDEALIEFPVQTKLNLPHLQLNSASSSSLAVNRANGRLTITAGPQTEIPAVNRVELEFERPEVIQPTMYLLSGRQRIADNGWQCFVRGIVIEP